MSEREADRTHAGAKSTPELDLDAEVDDLWRYVHANGWRWFGRGGFAATYAEVQRVKADMRARLERIVAAARSNDRR